MNTKAFALLFILTSLSLFSYGHAGHGHHQEEPVLHYLTSPVHYIPILVLFLIGIYFLTRKKNFSLTIRRIFRK